MSLKVWKAKWDDLLGCILSVYPINELKISHVLHPIKTIKRSYIYGAYAMGNDGGWDCDARPGIDCPNGDAQEECEGCPYHIYHKPFTPWLGGFVFIHLVHGTARIVRAAVCFQSSHRLEDCSTAGPESGNMDHRCVRCERYWHVPLY